MLAIIIVMGFLAVLKQDNPAVAWFLGICAVQSVVVLFMSIKKGMGGWAKTDIFCLVIAALGIILWRVTNNPALALYASVTADAFGMIPTLIKTYRFPDTEFWLATAFDLSAITLTLFAVRNGGFNEYLYPSYLFVVETLVFIFILRPKLVHKTN